MLAFGQPMRKMIISFNKYTYFLLFNDKITTQKGMQCFFSFLTVPSHSSLFPMHVMTYIRHPVKKLHLIS